jgi:hypothetical protein
MENNQDIFDWIRETQHSDQPEIDKLKAFFGRITSQIVEFAEKEIELTKAMQDHESLLKVQIKMETIKTARRIFGRGYQIATGKKAWDEQDKR